MENLNAKKMLEEFESMTDEERELWISDLLNQNYERLIGQGMSVDEATTKIREENHEVIDLYELRRRTQQSDMNNYLITYRPSHMVLVDPRITGPLFFEGQTEVQTEAKEITTVVSINYDNNTVSQMLHQQNIELNSFDKSVHDAITTLYVNGNAIMSIAMIYRVMNASNSPNTIPSANTAEAIKESILKLMRSFAVIEGTMKDTLNTKTYHQPLISGQFSIETFSNGVKDDCLVVTSPPILFRYVKTFDSVSAVEMNLLTSDVNSSTGTISVRSYIVAQLQLAIQNNEQWCTLSLERAYEIFMPDINSADAALQKTIKQRARNYIKRFLDTWVETGLVRDYVFVKHDPANSRLYSHVMVTPCAEAFKHISGNITSLIDSSDNKKDH